MMPSCPKHAKKEQLKRSRSKHRETRKHETDKPSEEQRHWWKPYAKEEQMSDWGHPQAVRKCNPWRNRRIPQTPREQEPLEDQWATSGCQARPNKDLFASSMH